jgi:hypothetical protein
MIPLGEHADTVTPWKETLICLLSFIRTVTVGSGIQPDLLTFTQAYEALAGSGNFFPLPPVGSFTPP